MDIRESKNIVTSLMTKYRYFILLLIIGIVLMMIPEEEKVQEEIPGRVEQTEQQLQDALSETLSLIQGAGKVKVLLTQETGEQTVYQTDGTASMDTEKNNTVLITNASREETGLIRHIHSPVYRGAIVLCQGADNAKIRLSIVEAVKSVTGLTSDRITVLVMK